MYQPHQLGKWGEERAAEFLTSHGYKVIERNFKLRWGEIDIVARKKDVLIFVEVKTIEKPDTTEPFFPEDEIDEKKQRQLVKMVQIYLNKKKIHPETPCQIDVIAIEKTAGKPVIRHYKNALEDSF